MGWQKTFNLLERAKGCHLVTKEILAEIGSGLEGVQTLIDAAFSSDVRTDMDMALDVIVPESLDWRHTDEGSDDS
ncbi:hypothetical protein C0989_010505 [Termitomyces sp. Mn162]|nr:hypothetical protein C0989_010505 [Termitomyces sp. Mn162]